MELIPRILKYENRQCFSVDNYVIPNNDVLILIHYKADYGFISANVIRAGEMDNYILATAISEMEDGEGETQEILDKFAEYMITEINKGKFLEDIDMEYLLELERPFENCPFEN